LFDIGVEALEKEGWKVSRVPGSGKSSLRRITRGTESLDVSIRTTQDTWIAFPRTPDDKSWRTLSDVDAVVAVSVDDIGKGRALELLLTGEPIDAAEAHRIGLVNRVVKREALLDEAKALAKKILAAGPVAVRLTIDAVNRGLDATLPGGLEIEADLFGQIASTSDMKEGTSAFLEKRPPKFTGK
jgi:hypothetical protein